MGRHRTLEERIRDLESRIEEIRARERARSDRKKRSSSASSAEDGPRFSPVWVSRQRQKLGLSAADFGRLVGVSGLSIYNWEKGKVRPRRKQVEALASLRGVGKREARRRLEAEAPATRRRRARKA
jgi:DNA-binding transcriptional regulator YiaG